MKSKVKKILAGVVFLSSFSLFTLPAHATDTKMARTKLSLVDAISMALENNEDIQESFHRITSAQADVMIAKGSYDLNVYSNLSYGKFEDLSINDYSVLNYSNATKSYVRSDTGLRQRVPTGGTLTAYYTTSNEQRLGFAAGPHSVDRSYFTFELAQSLLKGLGDKENRAAIKNALLAVSDSEENRKLVISQTTLSVIRAYWTLSIAQNNLKVGNRVLRMAEEIHRREIARFQDGLSQGVDVDRVLLAVEQRRYAVEQYMRDVDVATEQLLFLLNAPALDDKVIDVASPPLSAVVKIPAEATSVDVALQNRYELRQLGLMLEQLGVNYDVQKNKLLPQLDAVAGFTTSNGNSYIRQGEAFRDTDEKSSWYVGLNFTYPLQNREARGAVRKSEQLIRIAKDRINKTRRGISTEVKEVLHSLSLAQKGIPIAEKSYKTALKVVDGERARFEMGGINNRDLLSSQDALAREEINYYIALVNYSVSKSEYDFACAALLAKYGISILEDHAVIR